jgi:hypothetical protein
MTVNIRFDSGRIIPLKTRSLVGIVPLPVRTSR